MRNYVLLGVFILFLAGCTTSNTVNIDENDEGLGQDSMSGQAVFGVTDAAANMGSVSEVTLVIDELSVHHTTEGWVTVSSETQSYDLLELEAQGATQLLADANLAAGTYNQMRLHVQEVIVVDTEGEHQATLPSDELRLQGRFTVEENSTTVVTFDFLADESLHVTGNGEYIMAPVIQLESRTDADVSMQSNNRIIVTGGSVETDSRIGMDINGNMGVGLNIPANVELRVDSVLGTGANIGSAVSAVARNNTSGEAGVTGQIDIY